MGKIKVLEIIGNCTLGGVETYIFNYCSKMKDNYEFTFLCFEDSKYLPYEFAKSIGAKVELVPNIKHLCKFNKKLDYLLKKEHFDIIHSHLNTLSVFPLRIAKKNNYPIRIAHSHALSSSKEIVRDLIKKVLKRYSLKYATHYFATSIEAGIYMYGEKAKDKIVIVPGLIDTSKFQFNKIKREELRKDLGLKDNDYVVGQVGRLCETKNQKLILRVAKEYQTLDSNYKFIFIGTGDEEKVLKEYVKSNNLNNVMFLGAKKNIEDYYNIFDCLVLPSLYEGYGLVSIEAETNGLYVFESNTLPHSTLLDECGEEVPLNVSSWVNVLKNKKERNNLIVKLVKEKFDINTNDYLDEAYEKIINN